MSSSAFQFHLTQPLTYLQTVSTIGSSDLSGSASNDFFLRAIHFILSYDSHFSLCTVIQILQAPDVLNSYSSKTLLTFSVTCLGFSLLTLLEVQSGTSSSVCSAQPPVTPSQCFPPV